VIVRQVRETSVLLLGIRLAIQLFGVAFYEEEDDKDEAIL